MRKFAPMLALIAALAILAGLMTLSASIRRERESYRVYEAIIADDLASLGSGTTVVIWDEAHPVRGAGFLTMFPSYGRDLQELGLATGTWEDFATVYASSQRLERAFQLQQSYQLMSHEKFAGLTGDDEFWRAFQLDHGGAGGFYVFSRVGFNDAGTEALVHVAFSCGGRCGDSQLVWLQFGPAGWQIRERLITGVS